MNIFQKKFPFSLKTFWASILSLISCMFTFGAMLSMDWGRGYTYSPLRTIFTLPLWALEVTPYPIVNYFIIFMEYLLFWYFVCYVISRMADRNTDPAQAAIPSSLILDICMLILIALIPAWLLSASFAPDHNPFSSQATRDAESRARSGSSTCSLNNQYKTNAPCFSVDESYGGTDVSGTEHDLVIITLRKSDYDKNSIQVSPSALMQANDYVPASIAKHYSESDKYWVQSYILVAQGNATITVNKLDGGKPFSLHVQIHPYR